MRFLLSRSTCWLSLLIASSASAVTMAWTPIGNPGNACDTQAQSTLGPCYGAVGYAYHIGTYDVTNAQYAEFLNSKAANNADPLGLYNPSMGTDTNWGGIARTGSSGSYSYAPIVGRGDWPVNYVSFYDALRFANWMNNGQGSGDTETGAYTLLGGTAAPSNGTTVARNAGAAIVLTSENEWYKAAYYNALSMSYFTYPAGSSTQTICAAPSATPNTANCGNAVDTPTIKGSYTGAASPYGTYDQGGNVSQWTETEIPPILPAFSSSRRVTRGGNFGNASSSNASTSSGADPETDALPVIGFRLAMIPEPGTGLLVIAGLLGLAGWRRVSA
jgi:sulfatase modifying factor 1